jgi:hypothetical protein
LTRDQSLLIGSHKVTELTAPVRDAYFALCNTNLTRNLDGVNGFIHKNEYPSPMNALRSEWGAIGNLRFLISSIGSQTLSASANGNTVYNIFCVGKQIYAHLKSSLIDLEALWGDKAQVAFATA